MSAPLFNQLELLGLLALEVAVIVCLAAQVQRLTKSALWRRAIGHVCLLSLILLIVFEFTGAARNLSGWAATRMRFAPAAPVASTTKAGPVIAAPAEAQLGASANGVGTARPDMISSHEDGVVRSRPHPVSSGREAASPAPAHQESRSATPSTSVWIPAISLAWLVGIIAVLGRVLWCRVALEVFRWRRQQVNDVELQNSVRDLAARLGIRRRVRFMESNQICGPVAFGIVRPTIGLPAQFGTKFSDAQQAAMLAHELAHLAGNDPAWYLLADLLAALLWWHPLIWWARHRLHAESELAADEASLLVANGPSVLAECLVEIGGRLARNGALRQMGVGGNGFRSGLGRRVERLVNLEGVAWRPLNQTRCGLARTLGPVLLVTTTILCTAWVMPQAQNKGENMQTLGQHWKKSLTAFALLTALSSDINSAPAQPAVEPEVAPAPAAPAEPPSAPQPFAPVAPRRFPDGMAPPPALATSPGMPAPAAQSTFQDRLMKIVANAQRPFPMASSAGTLDTEGKRAVDAKLRTIMVDNIKFDGLPLTEVVNNLVELAKAGDPDKKGINVIVNRESFSGEGIVTTDPASGLPAAMAAVDVSSVVVNINPALKEVRLIDLLEVIAKSADHPVKYSIEDYGVMISLDLSRMNAGPVPTAVVEPLEVRTFIMDTNTFLPGLERTFGVKVDANHAQPEAIQATLKHVLEHLGIDMSEPNKSVFYNDVTGIIMVRTTRQDMALVEATIETLGGRVNPTMGGGGGFGGRR